MHCYQKGPLDNPNDGDVADEIEIEVVIESCIDCGSSIRAKKRIAIAGARTTASVAILLAAPGRFSMTNG
jgi:hypothetical protein